MHTKGMRNNQAGGGIDAQGVFSWTEYRKQPAHSWREYMTFFLVEKYNVCHVLLRQYNFYTCGVLKQGSLYAGNFWWAKVSWLKQQQVNNRLEEFEWAMHTRMEAEKV